MVWRLPSRSSPAMPSNTARCGGVIARSPTRWRAALIIHIREDGSRA
ncbi:hypothetical protein KCP73_16455 [Salmonella enterica subsp. enterica]|nr:hypothetical protein KCP73_16455 [Salmonella enterica subsp. enterica]